MTADSSIHEANVHDPSSHLVGLFIAEESALKRYFEGITIPTRGGAARQVGVYFRWPDTSKNVVYPFITLDYLNIVDDYERMVSEFNLGKVPAEFVRPDGTTYVSQYQPSVSADTMPGIADGVRYTQRNHRPVKLFYQVAVHARDALDDRYLNGMILTDYLNNRHIFLGVDADGTWRRAERVSTTNASTQETTETSKRVFRTIYTISIEAEIPQEKATLIPNVHTVHADIYDRDQSAREPQEHAVDSEHSVSYGNFTVSETDNP